DEDDPAVDRSVARHHAVAREPLGVHPELRRAVFDEGVRFDETAGIEQELDPFAGGQLPLCVLRLDPILAPALFGKGLPTAPFVAMSYALPITRSFPIVAETRFPIVVHCPR